MLKYLLYIYVYFSSFIDLFVGIGTFVAFIIDSTLINNAFILVILDNWSKLINVPNIIISTGLLLIFLFTLKAILSIYTMEE